MSINKKHQQFLFFFFKGLGVLGFLFWCFLLGFWGCSTVIVFFFFHVFGWKTSICKNNMKYI